MIYTIACVLTLLSIIEGLSCNPEDYRIYATSYSWELGGHNCDNDCGDVASGLKTSPELLGKVAACPQEWIGRVWTTVITLADGSVWYCVDAFGHPMNRRMRLMHIPYYHKEGEKEPVFRVDFAVANPADFPYNNWLLSDWKIETRRVDELYKIDMD